MGWWTRSRDSVLHLYNAAAPPFGRGFEKWKASVSAAARGGDCAAAGACLTAGHSVPKWAEFPQCGQPWLADVLRSAGVELTVGGRPRPIGSSLLRLLKDGGLAALGAGHVLA